MQYVNGGLLPSQALEMVSTLARHTGELINGQVPNQWRWHGKRVHLIDGTTVTPPDTEKNQAVYPQQEVQKPGLGFPITRIVGILCLSSGALGLLIALLPNNLPILIKLLTLAIINFRSAMPTAAGLWP